MTEASSPSIQVVGICDSLRKGSCARMALHVALEGAKEAGARNRLIDLSEYQLIFCDAKEDESVYPKDVFKLREDVRAAQGIILVTPECHGGYSGVLKNALDLTGFEEFEGKMLGLVGVSAGRMGALGAMNSLREVGRALHARMIPEQAAIPEAYKVFDESGTLQDRDLEQHVKEVGRQVARFAYLHTSEQAKDFLKAWEGALVNPGGAKD
jgi:FMN reductase